MKYSTMTITTSTIRNTNGSRTSKGKNFRPTFEVKLGEDYGAKDAIYSPPIKQTVKNSTKQYQSQGDEIDSDMDDVGVEDPIPNFSIPAKSRLK